MICSRLAVSEGEVSKMSSAKASMTMRRKGDTERPATSRLERVVGSFVEVALLIVTILALKQAFASWSGGRE